MLEIERLRVVLGNGRATLEPFGAVDLVVAPGEIGALVGQSGCGKSTLAQAVLGLLPPPSRIGAGSIRLDGRRIDNLPDRLRRSLLGRTLALVPQDPFAALHPLASVGRQLHETLSVVLGLRQAAAAARAAELLAEVDLPDPAGVLAAYPHQLSGGMAQRVAIALALATAPRWLVADEPTAALDPIRAKRILDLLAGRAHRHGLGILLITHDLAAVTTIADRLTVLGAAPAPRDPERHYPTALPRGLAARPDHRRGPAMLRLEQVCVDRPGPGSRRQCRRILDEVSLTIGQGETVAVVGPSGGGKSTLAAAIVGLVRPSSGRIVLTHGAVATDRYAPGREVQLVFQDFAASLDPRWPVAAIIAEPLLAYGLASGRRAAARAARALLEQVGLDQRLATVLPGRLSGGQKQRVALARALAARPRLLILDEPTASLDAAARDRVLTLLALLREDTGLSMLLISHDAAAVGRLADRVLVLDAGRLVAAPPPPLRLQPVAGTRPGQLAKGGLVEAAQLA